MTDIRLSKLTERHVQAIWYDRDLRPLHLMTRDGLPVHVVHPGEWNRVSGPDFRSAVLEVGAERRRLVGDVEIHLSPDDWEAHGHGGDAAYQQVIAHVTWLDGLPPTSLPKGAVSIALGRYLLADSTFSPEAIDVGTYPFDKQPAEARPCHGRSGCSPAHAREALTRAGRWRLRVKAERLRRRLRMENAHQVFYSEVMNALGYGKNSAGFRSVATAVPYAMVAAEPQNVSAAFQTAASFVEWHRDRIRPSNAPEVRLASAARLFTETDVMTLAEAHSASQDECRKMLSVLSAGGHVGRGRAAAIIANVVIPFCLASGTIGDVPSWLPPEDVCEPVRRLANRMFGGDHNPRVWYASNDVFIQGLIQIDRECCARMHPLCKDCSW